MAAFPVEVTLLTLTPLPPERVVRCWVGSRGGLFFVVFRARADMEKETANRSLLRPSFIRCVWLKHALGSASEAGCGPSCHLAYPFSFFSRIRLDSGIVQMSTAKDSCAGCGRAFAPGGYMNHLRFSHDPHCGSLRNGLMPRYTAALLDPFASSPNALHPIDSDFPIPDILSNSQYDIFPCLSTQPYLHVCQR